MMTGSKTSLLLTLPLTGLLIAGCGRRAAEDTDMGSTTQDMPASMEDMTMVQDMTVTQDMPDEDMDGMEETDMSTSPEEVRSAGCMNTTPGWTPAQSSEESIMFGGQERTFRVRLPEGYDHTQSYPVVFALHGGFGSGERMENETTNFNPVADSNGIIMIYPDGVAQFPRADSDVTRIRTWNAGGCCGHAQSENIDDVGALKKILEYTEEIACVDSKRVYSTGMSNGAMMSYRLACEASDTFAAVAPVGASLVFEPCEPERPVPVVHIHGLEDKNAPFEGGMGCGPGDTSDLAPVPELMDRWDAMLGCSGEEEVLLDTADVTCVATSGCGQDVQLCTLPNGNHSWPGGIPKNRDPLPGCEGGEQVESFYASEYIWNFFKDRTL